MDMTSYNYMAETVCTALCSSPDLLARMNEELRGLITCIEDPANEIEQCWLPEQQEQICAFINESANMVSEVVNGNKL